ncbi:metal ABC transporter substrate-binding protein [Natronosalvus rutilus]|uniref:Metal ABC transporter substrate-binding protein n=1 Tax=Natronosalvus rutilus TaxID=2953753 RepID=A0A9E7NAK6_9EURY|nr:metal ABC transporter substrate-binding protein [Natronosalvus rutilus]UTF53388.1 metal ABC transporter substrate-binding protein [Natronosalvus rutilus]
MNLTRRRVLGHGASALGVGALAGCLSEPGADGDGGDASDLSGYAAFFPLWDWTNQVVGDAGSIENPVDAGQLGHGWSPEGDLVRTVAETDAFVYFDSPEFTWAQDIAGQLEAESNSTDVVVIDALEGISEDHFLSFSDDGHDGDDGGHDDEDDHSHGDDHEGEHDDGDDHESEHDDGDHVEEHDNDPESLSVDEFELLTSSSDVTATWHDDHWDGGVPPVPADGSIELEAAVQVDGEDLAFGADESHQLWARVADDGSTDVLEIESHGDAIEIRGRESGQTRVIFELRRDDERVWDSSADPLRVEVAADAGSGMTAFHDPHVWLDPVLAADVVHAIADGLADVAPDDADTFEANAEAYAERLAEVDEQLRALVDEADLEVAVLAGHDSFRYLERRYGFELHSPVGVSPDESPSAGEIAETIELVDERGIDTILYDPFEVPEGDVPPLAETIVHDSQATETAPLTPVGGTLTEWNDRDWGWVEQMTEVNLPSLRAALEVS